MTEPEPPARKPWPMRPHPCEECPWVRTTPPGQFSAARYRALADTTGTRGHEAPAGASLFGCHKSTARDPMACAGWLAAVGRHSITARLFVAWGYFRPDALRKPRGWPPLFRTYRAMARAMGRKPRQG